MNECKKMKYHKHLSINLNSWTSYVFHIVINIDFRFGETTRYLLKLSPNIHRVLTWWKLSRSHFVSLSTITHIVSKNQKHKKIIKSSWSFSSNRKWHFNQWQSKEWNTLRNSARAISSIVFSFTYKLSW